MKNGCNKRQDGFVHRVRATNARCLHALLSRAYINSRLQGTKLLISTQLELIACRCLHRAVVAPSATMRGLAFRF